MHSLSRRIVCLSILAILWIVPAGAQTPKGKEVIDAAVKALGGDQFLQMKSRVASGRIYSFFHNELKGLDVTTTYTDYPEGTPKGELAIRERELLGKKRDYSYLFLPNQGWDITFRGARPIEDEAWERYKRSTRTNVLYILKCRLGEPGWEFDYVGNQVYLSRHIEVVDLISADGETIRVFFDYNSKLPIRQVYNWLDPETRQRNEEITVFDKWKDIGQSVMWPYSIERDRNGYKAYQLFAEKAEANISVPPKTFELPAGAKVLQKVD